LKKDEKQIRGHAIALFSGGLDSALAILLIQKQNIKVTALTFLTHFGCDITDRSSCGGDPFPMAEKFGFTVKLVHLGEKFIDIVKAPRYGYGKNMNPCIDCRILMLQEAKRFMELTGADFVFTGEVLGQRPKSQMRNAMNTVYRESQLEGLLVRPLSAKLLPETIPEKNGLLDREQLLDLSGRSRKPQLQLAAQFGLEDYTTPGGGCLLTDPQYSLRLKDLLKFKPGFDTIDINLLRVGRHFRLNDNCRLVVGRNEQENNKIVENSHPPDLLLEAKNTGSPIGLLLGNFDEQTIIHAASITARYCDLKNEPLVNITCTDNKGEKVLSVKPASPAETSDLMIT
jgi:tRNA-uridine 2-sulfurtransferase